MRKHGSNLQQPARSQSNRTSFDPAYEPGWIYKRLPNQETRNGSEFTSTIHHIATDENRKIRNRRSYL